MTSRGGDRASGDRARGRRLGIAVAGAAAAVLTGGVVLLHQSGQSADTASRLVAGAATRHIGAAPGRGGGSGGGSGPVDPSLFNQGSCVAFPPDGTNPQGTTVFIDAGHGGPDPGGVGRTQGGAPVSEARVNLPIAMDAMRALTGDGYRVVVSRTTSGPVSRLRPGDIGGDGLFTFAGAHQDIAARPACADAGHANLLVGLYMNSGGPGSAGSVTGWDPVRPFSRRDHRFASLLQADVLGRLNHAGYGIPDGGVQTDSELGSTLTAEGQAYGHLVLLGPPMKGYVTTPSRMPGALIEPLFITDPFEASIADSPRGQHLIASGVADAVRQYFAG